jgi:hypothetical protein
METLLMPPALAPGIARITFTAPFTIDTAKPIALEVNANLIRAVNGWLHFSYSNRAFTVPQTMVLSVEWPSTGSPFLDKVVYAGG